MKKPTWLILLLLALAALFPGELLADKPGFTESFKLDECSFITKGRNPYFILEPGYQLILEGKEDEARVRLEITVLDETETVAGVTTRVVTEVEYADNQLTEISRNYFALCEPANSVFYFGEDVDIYEDGEIVGHEGAWKAGENGARPGLMMPGSIELSARYVQEVAPGVSLDRAMILSVSEVVETPAGRFEHALKIEETNPLEPSARDFKFYAPGVGLVQDSSLKLVKFPEPPPVAAASLSSEMISLTVPAGTILQVALDDEVKVKEVNQPIHGLVVEPVYAFDQEVIPVGSEVLGRITELTGVSRMRRVFAALNMNFTPTRKVGVKFDEIVLPDGNHVSLKSVVTHGSGRTIQLVTTADKDKQKTSEEAPPSKMKQAIREAKRKWESAMKQIKTPGKLHRLKRAGLAQLPVHRQYIDAGTVYFAELQEPLDFGSKPLPPPTLNASDPLPLPCSLLAHAQLVTPLNSATTLRDAPVTAVLLQPLFSGDRLVLPQGSELRGSVVHVQPARRWGRNGQLRIAFHELVPPDGLQQVVAANLEGVQADQNQQVKLDLEGGTQSTAPKRRYFSTGLNVALAVAAREDSDVEDGVSSSGSGTQQGMAGGAAAFRLVGLVGGAFIHSQPIALGMGVYGASRSVYSNFLGRGREVVFPKGTAMEIGFSPRGSCDESAAAVPQ